MSKYCQDCGANNSNEAGFCLNCGTKLRQYYQENNLFEKEEDNQSIAYQKNQEMSQQPISNAPTKNYKFLTVISVIFISAVIIGAYLISGFIFTEGTSNPSINKVAVKGGPKINIESIVNSGNALTTPEIGHTAVYGYYMSGEKLGELSFTTVGQENYKGEQCYKIIGGGSYNFEIYGQSMDLGFDINAYVSKSDGKLAFFDYDFDINQPFNIDMSMTLDINKENGEITVTVDSSMMESQSTLIKTSEDYWDCTLLKDDLFEGYLKEVAYTMSVMGIETEVNLIISVTGVEDVTVNQGTFEDCYVVEIEQDQGIASSTSIIWIDEDGICPKMQLGGSSTSSFSYEGMIIELEEYYTTY
ncbi:hypothetical protein AYK21_01065 [Thermoplasmatales archaeon SG8-52-2]|nr:MAG: hypothetical protein AYK21_01065 [Thermoplasmatales archaeon SG8-52-2]